MMLLDSFLPVRRLSNLTNIDESKINMNCNNRIQNTSKRIKLFFYYMLVGFFLACLYHGVLDWMGYSWPWNSFLFNPTDRYNDWYNSVAQAASVNPYYSSNHALATYFPVSYVLLKIAVGYGPVTSISIYFLISIILLILVACIARILIWHNGDSAFQYTKDALFLVLATLISYPALFALDRGNIDIWIGLLGAIFVLTQRTKFWIVGLLFLSLAISLKGYPAVLLLLLVSERQYMRMIFCSLLAFLISLITLYFLWDGFDLNLTGFLSNLNSYYRMYVLGKSSLFASSDPYNMTRAIFFGLANLWQKFISPNYVLLPMEVYSASILKVYSLLSLSFATIAAFFVLAIPEVRWKKVTALCLIALLFPNVSNDYKLCFLFPGLYLFLIESENSTSEKVTFALFCLLMVPKSYLFIAGKPISMIINPLLITGLAYKVMEGGQNWKQAIQMVKCRLLFNVSTRK